jgi:fluoroacetyl-CoA thioesterase
MKPVPIGASHSSRIEVVHAHTAEAFGNKGVTVLATPMLIGFLEGASHQAIEPYLEPGEGSVGTLVNVRHLAAAPIGALVEVSAKVSTVKGRLIEFAVEAHWNEILLMIGVHGRAVIDLARFRRKLAGKTAIV